MLAVHAADQLVKRAVEIVRLFELLRELRQLLRDNGIQDNVRAGDGQAGAEHPELELVAGESERGGAVAIRRILGEAGENVHADLQLRLVLLIIAGTRFDGIEHGGQLVAEEDGDDRRRGLVRAETVIVPCAGDGDAKQIGILVHSLDDGGEEQQELRVLTRGIAGSSRFTPVLVEIDQLLCLPLPLTPSNGFS